MTDDRARRIRDLRKRTAGGGGGDDDEAGDPEDSTDAPDAGDDEGSESPDGEPVKADGNGEGASASGDGDAPSDEDDEGGEVGAAEEAEEANEPAEPTEADDADDADDTDGGSEVSDELAPESTSDVDDPPEPTAATVADEPADGSSEPATTGADADAGADADQTAADASTGSETTVAAAAQTATVASPAGDVGGGQGLKPMVEAAASDSPFGGAIANEDVLADFVDDVGTGESDAMAAGAQRLGDTDAGRGASVFDRDDSLVATTHEDDTIQMLEFYLNDDRYAIEIERISAIVEMKRITRFPRGPEAIDGVTDLRGEITAVLDPTAMLDVERNELSDDQYIVVLERDDDKQKLGIRVTDVLQAVTYRESQIDETASVMDAAGDHAHEFVNGIVKKTTDGRTELVTWLDVDSIIENTE